MAVACGWLLGGFGARAADGPSQVVTVVTNLAYVSGGGATAYQIERSKLDLYLPEGKAGFATLVWFHGGALKEGRKDDSFSTRIGYRLASSGLAVAMANYRLSPMAKYPSYIDDAAAAFAWVKSNIAGRGGDPKRVFVGGHSAGAYLTFMLGLDRGYLARRGLDTSAIAGLIPVSGQTMTHYTVREERGLDKDTIFADAAAPIYHVRKDAPPLLLIFADQDLPARVEENRYLVAALKAVGHTNVIERMISGRDHGSVAGNIAQPGDPAAEAILRFVDATPIR
jgi:acetyl esterase/lipase